MRVSSGKRRVVLSGLVALALSTGLVARAGERLATDAAASEARIAADLKYLTSEECEGRGVTTQGINKAADHIAAELKKAGVKPGGVDGTYFQPFEMGSTAKLGEKNSLSFTGPQGQTVTLEMDKHFTVMGFGGSGRVKAPVVFAGYGITSKDPAYDDFAGLDVAGKVVVVLRRGPSQGFTEQSPGFALTAKAALAQQHKAAALVIVNDTVKAVEGGGQDPLVRFSDFARVRDGAGLPVVQVRRSFVNQMVQSAAGKDLAEIEKAIDATGKPASLPLDGWTCELEANVTRQGTVVKNIIGVVEGSGPHADEVIVIGAHYDHLGYGGFGSMDFSGKRAIHPGADDNGSGTVTVLELARRFAAMPDRQGRKLVFMWFTAEESGLIGSMYYCRNPLFPLDKTVAMVNFDMVGRLREGKITANGVASSPVFAQMLDEANKKPNLSVEKVMQGGPFFRQSDHFSFYQKDIPVVFFFTGMHPQYHRPTDTFETANVPGMRQIAELGESLIDQIAKLPERPKFVKLTGDTPRAAENAVMRGPRLGVMPAYEDKGEGMLVQDVTAKGVGDKAGLKKDDRIIEIEGKPVKGVEGYMSIMNGFKKGDKITITVKRGTQTLKLPAVLE